MVRVLQAVLLANGAFGRSPENLGLLQPHKPRPTRSTQVDQSAKSDHSSSLAAVQTQIKKVVQLHSNEPDGSPLSVEVLGFLATIVGLLQSIRDDIQQSHPHTIQSLHALADIFTSCLDIAELKYPNLQQPDNPLELEWQNVTGSEADHNSCRSKEVGDRQDAVGSGSLCDAFVQTIPTRPELTFTGLDTFWQSNFDPKDSYEKATTCNAAVTEYKSSVATCHSAQHQFEQSTCTFHKLFVSTDNACFESNKCRMVDGRALEEACVAALQSAQAWNAAELALDQIDCMFQKLNASNFSQMQQCTMPAAGTGDWDITCPELTTTSKMEDRCEKAAAHRKTGVHALNPSDAGWVSAKYSAKSWFASATNNALNHGQIEVILPDCDVPTPERVCSAVKHCNAQGATNDTDSEDGCDCDCDVGWTGTSCDTATSAPWVYLGFGDARDDNENQPAFCQKYYKSGRYTQDMKDNQDVTTDPQLTLEGCKAVCEKIDKCVAITMSTIDERSTTGPMCRVHFSVGGLGIATPESVFDPFPEHLKQDYLAVAEGEEGMCQNPEEYPELQDGMKVRAVAPEPWNHYQTWALSAYAAVQH